MKNHTYNGFAPPHDDINACVICGEKKEKHYNKQKPMKEIRNPYTFDTDALRKKIAEKFKLPHPYILGKKLPKWFAEEDLYMLVPLKVYYNANSGSSVHSRGYNITVLPSCPVSRREKDFYLHRIKLQCVHCEGWFDVGHIKQHKC